MDIACRESHLATYGQIGGTLGRVPFPMVALLVLCAAGLAYLFYVRHRDGHFWDEEEARRADWDRRGRQL